MSTANNAGTYSARSSSPSSSLRSWSSSSEPYLPCTTTSSYQWMPPTPDPNMSSSTERISLATRLHALNLAITALESQYASMLATYNSLPPAIFTDPDLGADPEDLHLCRRELSAPSRFFRSILGSGNAIEATRLRGQACRIQTLLVLRRYDNAVDDLTLAEQDIARYHVQLSNVRFALDHLSLIAQHHVHTQHVKDLQNTIVEFEDSYASLKARYHALSASPAALQDSVADLWDLVFLDEAFGESLVKESEVEILMSRLKAVAAKAETAVDSLGTDYEVQDLMQEAWTVVNDAARHLAELERLVGEQESKQEVRKWLAKPRPSSNEPGSFAAVRKPSHPVRPALSSRKSLDTEDLRPSDSESQPPREEPVDSEAQRERDEIQNYLAMLPLRTPWPEFCSVREDRAGDLDRSGERNGREEEKRAQREKDQEMGVKESWHTCSEGRRDSESSESSGSWVVI